MHEIPKFDYRIFAVVGPDGSGKTTYLEQYHGKLVRATYIAKWFSVSSKRWRVLTEGLISIDRVFQSWRSYIDYKVLHRKVIMDRCFICAATYGKLWSDRYDSKMEEKVVMVTNKLLFKPKFIVQLVPMVVKTKDGVYQNDKNELNIIYTSMLKGYGYKVIKTGKYGLGYWRLWKCQTC